MKQVKSLFTSLVAVVFFLIPVASYAEGPLRLLATTFPIELLTKEVVKDAPTVVVERMLPAGIGCPHEYTLNPQDMQKIASADIVIANGLGLEEFLGTPLKKANPKVRLIESGLGIKKTDLAIEKHDNHEKHHDHEGVNPHVFASPGLMGEMATYVAQELGKIDQKNSKIYLKNAQNFRDRMKILTSEFVQLSKSLKNKRIVTHHEIFEYLARDMGLDIVGVVQEQSGQEPSTTEILKLNKEIKQKRAAAVFTEPQYPARYGEILAKEAKIPIATLDPIASGPENSSVGYYEKTMRANIEVLRKTLGTK